MPTTTTTIIPKMGPSPTLLSRKEVDTLYEIFTSVIAALDILQVDYIVTGGSLLGCVRQHSILFCDDDIDIAIIDTEDGDGVSAYDKVRNHLGPLLGDDFIYSIRPWEGGDKVRLKRMSSVFLDIFTLRCYTTREEMVEEVIGRKTNGQRQEEEYVDTILTTMNECASSASLDGSTVQQTELFPCWHFNTRKAVEMWPKEVYRTNELFPLTENLRFGPLVNVKGPRMPVLLLRRAFGVDCFHVYFQSVSHHQNNKQKIKKKKEKGSKAIASDDA